MLHVFLSLSNFFYFFYNGLQDMYNRETVCLSLNSNISWIHFFKVQYLNTISWNVILILTFE